MYLKLYVNVSLTYKYLITFLRPYTVVRNFIFHTSGACYNIHIHNSEDGLEPNLVYILNSITTKNSGFMINIHAITGHKEIKTNIPYMPNPSSDTYIERSQQQYEIIWQHCTAPSLSEHSQIIIRREGGNNGKQ